MSDYVEVKLAVKEGEEGIDTDLSNPIARATHRLLSDGQPFERLHVSFFNPKFESGLRWLGAFIWSAGERLVFFPGFVAPQKQLSCASSSQPLPIDKDFETDHITLEPDLLSWHVTTQGMKRKRETGFRTHDLGKGRVFWSGIHVSSPQSLRLLQRETIVAKRVPLSDKNRRGKTLQAAVDGAPHSCITIADATRITPPNFIYFGLIVGPTGFESVVNQHDLTLGLPSDTPFVQARESLPGEQSGLSIYRIKLNAPLEIDIVTALLPGTVTVPIAFTSPAQTA